MNDVPRLQVLVADDARVMRMLLRTMLNRVVHADVVEANDGPTALKCATAQVFDLVFLDINMPYMNGLTVLDSLRHTPEYRDRPIVMLTALGQERHRARGLALGASAYMLKPLREMELVRTLMKLVPEALARRDARTGR
ncbi:MAG: response regulator [Deltaproteobacteria bacterium]|nr:response regulator [Deltaproteobacteria bacterium]